jgi:transposase
MSYSQFCRRYKDWKDEAGKNVVMPMNREPGRELFVDWVGDTLDCVVDESTGELLTAHFFITTLGDSSYPFVEAFPDEKADKWIKGHVDSLRWYGGVPKIIVPDNTRTAVTSARYYDPEINKVYWDFAQHYAVAVVPARIRKPRDKGSVESGVGWLEVWLLEWLRGQVFYSFRELNAAIKKRVKELRQKLFRRGRAHGGAYLLKWTSRRFARFRHSRMSLPSSSTGGYRTITTLRWTASTTRSHTPCTSRR